MAADATRPHAADATTLLAERAWLRRLAAALVGESEADDLSQDAVVAALERAPTTRDALRPWLTTVVRRLAGQRWRREQRRKRRERAAARDEAQPATADVVARAELLRLVVDAVLALEEPYRSTVLLRHFDDLPVAEVARRTGVPLETARTRLRRGLEQVRGRLARAAGGRGAWVLPLAALARIPAPAAGTAALWLGGTVMTTQAKVLFGGAVALVAALCLWNWLPAPLPSVASSGAAPAAPLAAAPRAPEAGVAGANAAADRRDLARASAATDDVVRIRGRCVAAESGAPLAGCRVDVFDHLEGGSTKGGGADTSVTTGTDGCFTVAWAPREPRPRTLQLVFRPDGRGHESREWPHVRGGEDLDCRDVALTLGAALSGRVLDRQGRAVPQAIVLFTRETDAGEAAAPQQPRRLVTASSGGDGVLRAPQVLVPGRWRVTVDGEHQLVEPNELQVPPGAASVAADVVVRRPEELPAIAGVAVDGEGRPVRGLELHAHGRSVSSDSARTAADGSFTIRRTRGGDDDVRLQVFGAYRLLEPERTYRWGTRDVRVVVLTPVTARMFVTDAAGAPVERFAVRFQSTTGPFTRLLPVERVAARLRDGALVLTELPPDRYRVAVHADDAARGSMAPQELEVGDGTVLRVVLRPAAELRVRLRHGDGEPAVGSRVQLLRAEDGRRPHLGSLPQSLADTFANGGTVGAVVVDEAVSGADGTVVLRGPEAHDYAVRALGPGHAPLLQDGVALVAAGGELVLHVVPGATVCGTIRPREVLDELRAEACAPALWLQEDRGMRRRLPLDDVHGLRPGADGAFTFADVPAGDWNLVLRWYMGAGSDRRGARPRERLLAEVRALRDGEVRRVDADASVAQPARVRGLVLHEGEPWRRGRVRLGDLELATDDDGRFETEIDAGRHRLELLPPGDAWSFAGGALFADAPLDVAAGGTVAHTFEVRRRVLRLRVLEADGAPALGRLILLRGAVQRDDPPRDAEGWIVVDPAPPEPIEVLAYPRGFDAAARAAADPATRKRLVIRLGPVAVPPGEREARVDLRIPAGY